MGQYVVKVECDSTNGCMWVGFAPTPQSAIRKAHKATNGEVDLQFEGDDYAIATDIKVDTDLAYENGYWCLTAYEVGQDGLIAL
jgi:hypothetical protein